MSVLTSVTIVVTYTRVLDDALYVEGLESAEAEIMPEDVEIANLFPDPEEQEIRIYLKDTPRVSFNLVAETTDIYDELVSYIEQLQIPYKDYGKEEI